MVSKSKKDEADFVESEVEKYLIKNKIGFKKDIQVIAKFKPDFLLDNNIMLEVKWIDDSTSRQEDPPHERNMLTQATFRNQLLQKIYPEKNFKNIVIIKRKSGRYSPTNTLYGNIVFDLFLPYEYLDNLKFYLEGQSKEEIFFRILDDLFEKHWKKKRSTFPSVMYHFLTCVEKNKYSTASEFVKNERYTLSNQLQISNYLRPLELLGIIKKEKSGRDVNISILNKKWRYFTYLVILSGGTFTTIDLNSAKDMWNRIVKQFNI